MAPSLCYSQRSIKLEVEHWEQMPRVLRALLDGSTQSTGSTPRAHRYIDGLMEQP
jgi:hypothetical protein